jgi:hypothetical protein
MLLIFEVFKLTSLCCRETGKVDKSFDILLCYLCRLKYVYNTVINTRYSFRIHVLY